MFTLCSYFNLYTWKAPDALVELLVKAILPAKVHHICKICRICKLKALTGHGTTPKGEVSRGLMVPKRKQTYHYQRFFLFEYAEVDDGTRHDHEDAQHKNNQLLPVFLPHTSYDIVHTEPWENTTGALCLTTHNIKASHFRSCQYFI